MMQITVVMKIYWGDPREKLCEAAEHIPLSSIVIGNRGLGGLKRYKKKDSSSFFNSSTSQTWFTHIVTSLVSFVQQDDNGKR